MNYQEDSFYINKVLSGNLPAYAILVEKHKNLAYTLAFRIAKNHEDAEEIAQDSFLKAYNSLSTFKQEAKFSTWLYKIVFNTAISRARKKQILNVSIEESLPGTVVQEDQVSSLDNLHKKERKKIIASAIARLKEEESAVMTLYYLNENSLKEIEDITGLSNSNIKILLHRGRKKLFMELKKILKEEIVDML